MSDARPLPDGFDPNVTLSSEHLSLAPLTHADRAEVTQAASDPGIWAQHPVPDRWKPEVFGPYFEFLLANGGTMVARDPEGQVIGMSRFYASADAPEGIGIGFTFLVRDHWGGAANFEMKRLMIEHIFGTCGEVWFHIGPENLRSQKATAKLGTEPAEGRRLDLGTGAADYLRQVLRPGPWAKICAAR